MKAILKGDIYSHKEDFAQFDPGTGDAFDLIKITHSDGVLNLYLTRKQVVDLLGDMMQETALLMVAERSIKQLQGVS